MKLNQVITLLINAQIALNNLNDSDPKENIAQALSLLREHQGGNELFNVLRKKLISRIMEAEAITDTPDVELRLISIISERDYLKAKQALSE